MAAALLFDLDGTLIDSNDAHARSWEQALRGAGYPVPIERIRDLIGMGGDNLLPAAIRVEEDSPEGKKIAEARKRIFSVAFLPYVQPFPQVRLFVERLCNDGMRVVVASSAEKSEVERLLRVAHITDLVESYLTSDDVQRSKPAPDLIGAALEKTGYDAQEVLMVGDSPYDIQAANKVGVQVIAFRCGGFSDAQLRGALAIYDDPADALAHYDTSPFVG